MTADLNIDNFSIDKSNWNKVKFGDLVFEPKESAKGPLAESIEHVVGLEHIDSEDIHLRRSASIEDGTTFTKRFYKGDVLFGRRRAYLKKAAQAAFSGICSGDIIVMRVKKDVLHPDLLPFLVNNDKFFDFAIKHSAGGLSPRVKFKDLTNYELAIPDLDKQEELLDLLKKMDQMHEAKLTLMNRLKSYLNVFFEAELKEASYSRVTFREVLIDIVAGKSPKGLSRPAQLNEYGVLKVSAVGDGEYYETENKALINQSDFDAKYEVQNGFILVTRANALVSGVGRPCIVNNSREGLMLSDKTLRLIPNLDFIRERFLYQLLKTRAYRAYVESVAGGTEAKNISQKLIFGAPALLPSLEVQDLITVKLKALDVTISDIQTQIRREREIRKLINGRIF